MNKVIERVLNGDRFEMSFCDGTFKCRDSKLNIQVFDWSPNGKTFVKQLFAAQLLDDSFLFTHMDSEGAPMFLLNWQNIEFDTVTILELGEVDK